MFNIAYGGNVSLNQLFKLLRKNLAAYNPAINEIEPTYGPYRAGDIPDSQASIEKARKLLGYNPLFSAESGFRIACKWYWEQEKMSVE